MIARYAVVPTESWIAFEGRSTLHRVHGKAANLQGYVETDWSDGVPSLQPPPRMHVEFPVEQLRSGNALQDREMWKMIDSKRFPAIAADLVELRPGAQPGRFSASGRVTLAGRSRAYEGELMLQQANDAISIEGELALDIRDFGLQPPSLLLMKVEPAIALHLHVVAAPQR